MQRCLRIVSLEVEASKYISSECQPCSINVSGKVKNFCSSQWGKKLREHHEFMLDNKVIEIIKFFHCHSEQKHLEKYHQHLKNSINHAVLIQYLKTWNI